MCLKGCPTRAYTKFAEYGAVLQDPDICFGCGYCTWVCPYNAPQLDTSAGHVSKCNMCIDELEAGRDPYCVSACMMRVLDIGSGWGGLGIRAVSATLLALPVLGAVYAGPPWFTLLILAGAAVMVVELGVARILTPVFGGSIAVWALVIATTMLALAAGLALAGCQTTDPYTGEQKTSNTAKGAGIGAVGGAVAGADRKSVV